MRFDFRVTGDDVTSNEESSSQTRSSEPRAGADTGFRLNQLVHGRTIWTWACYPGQARPDHDACQENGREAIDLACVCPHHQPLASPANRFDWRSRKPLFPIEENHLDDTKYLVPEMLGVLSDE